MEILGLPPNLTWLLFFGLGSVLFLQLTFLVGRLLRPTRQQSVEATSNYECGEEVSTSATGVGFSVRFYLLALAFILFEVEILFLFAWALIVDQTQPSDVIAIIITEAFIFVFLLALGLAYLWRKGLLSWVTRPEAQINKRRLFISVQTYQKR